MPKRIGITSRNGGLGRLMLAARNVTLADVEAELDRREGRSGIAEEATRG